MAQRRKISLQDVSRKQSDPEISRLVRDMNDADMGFTPTDQLVYEVEINRIRPDLTQSRHILPSDLRDQLDAREITANAAMQELVQRSEQNDQVALLILGGHHEVLDEGNDGSSADIDVGLYALANSILRIGLRQPINLYSVPDPNKPGEMYYQIGEGERRFWAHHLLVVQGHQSFERAKCIIEPLPDDVTLIQRRQEAENAARQDLSAIARARSIKRIQMRLNLEMGTRVPNQSTIKLPNQHDLEKAVGQEVKSFTGRAISDRMVRNYLKLLKLPPELQDLAEAAQLTERQLRPVLRLKTDGDQAALIHRIIREGLSGRAVLEEVQSTLPPTSLRRTNPLTLEQRLEKRLFQTAKTVHEVLSLGHESYADIVRILGSRMSDDMTKDALISLRRVINDLIGDGEDDISHRSLALDLIVPPVDVIKSVLPTEHSAIIDNQSSGQEIFLRLLSLLQDDPVAASKIQSFVEQIEMRAERIKAREPVLIPSVREISESSVLDDGTYQYELSTGKLVYWAHILLVIQGFDPAHIITVEVII